jgi:putative ABC transport system permease protein
LLSYILVKAKADESAQAVAQRITDETDMVGLTADAFKRQSLAYFLRNTGILINFGFVVLVGFGVGAGATAIFAAVTRGGSGLAMTLNWQLLLGSGAAVLLIVMLAALISVCKVLTLEPAVVFKG